MLQIDHIYEFFYQNIFKNIENYFCQGGYIITDRCDIRKNIPIFTSMPNPKIKALFYDQEPFITKLTKPYINVFIAGKDYYNNNPLRMHFDNVEPDLKKIYILVTSEYSAEIDEFIKAKNFQKIYCFFLFLMHSKDTRK